MLVDEGGLARKGGKEGWKRAAEVGHHVNCIPDCGLLKSAALQRLTPDSPPPLPRMAANPKLDLTSQRPQASSSLQHKVAATSPGDCRRVQFPKP
ncbi:hypothetical protein M0804_009097 [Polistes exclamans]|nr:hypothetical protein M0804_009097 [Polistes exclamans]